MKNKLTLFLFSIFFAFTAFGQGDNKPSVQTENSMDIIILTNGQVMRGKVVEIGLETIKYKKSSYINGPVYTLLKEEVYAINYPNGSSDYMSGKITPGDTTNKKVKKLVLNKEKNQKNRKHFLSKYEEKHPSNPIFNNIKKLSKKGFTLRLGGGVNYMYGVDNKDNRNFDLKHLSWEGKTMIGYVLHDDHKGRATVIGAFGTVGNLGKESVKKYLEQAELSENPGTLANNLYYKVELGAVLFDKLRLSSGMGYQNFEDLSKKEKQVHFYSTTAGLQFGKRFIKIAIDVNFMYGRDLKQTIMQPSAGIILDL